ncbi:MAG: hypothetical protein RIA65_01985, partial [Woeseia sp.]
MMIDHEVTNVVRGIGALDRAAQAHWRHEVAAYRRVNCVYEFHFFDGCGVNITNAGCQYLLHDARIRVGFNRIHHPTGEATDKLFNVVVQQA